MADTTVAPIPLRHGAGKLHGMKFGRLTAIEPTDQRSNGCGFVIWRCRCECGTETLVASGNLKRGHTKSCGCLFSEAITKHGSAREGLATREYRIWNAMKDRCRNPNNQNFHHYGGRGIRVCEQWLSFDNFLADMGPCPSGLSLERRDNSKGYSPDNCKWASRGEQARNTRRNFMLTFRGQTMCLTDWAINLGVRRSVLQNRLDNGWSIERTFTEPIRNRR